jgi:hypothetical protein
LKLCVRLGEFRRRRLLWPFDKVVIAHFSFPRFVVAFL